jgi:hypothetical protein
MLTTALRSGRAWTLTAGAAAVVVAAALGAASASAKGTVWLCKPGASPDPCTPGLSTTVYNAPLTRAIGVEHPAARRNPPIDCFYVYPTVSDEKTGNSDLTIQDTERSIALYQVSRYSQDCRVYAPMYRQVTLAGAGLPGTSGSASKANPALGVADVETALKTYLTRYNHGRGFVLIGHSQGSGVLEAVIARMVDAHPAVRRHLLSAILMGGNVLVKGNTGIGGDFKHIPACRGDTQLGCVIAFSTFDQPVPSDSVRPRREPQPRTEGGQGRSGAVHQPGQPRRRQWHPGPDPAQRAVRPGVDHRRGPGRAQVDRPDPLHGVLDLTGVLHRALRGLERRPCSHGRAAQRGADAGAGPDPGVGPASARRQPVPGQRRQHRRRGVQGVPRPRRRVATARTTAGPLR